MKCWRKKREHKQNEKREKSTHPSFLCFHIPKTWQILKRFSGAFYQAETF